MYKSPLHPLVKLLLLNMFNKHILWHKQLWNQMPKHSIGSCHSAFWMNCPFRNILYKISGKKIPPKIPPKKPVAAFASIHSLSTALFAYMDLHGDHKDVQFPKTDYAMLISTQTTPEYCSLVPKNNYFNHKAMLLIPNNTLNTVCKSMPR